MSTVKRAAIAAAFACAFLLGGGAVASAAPTRIDPGDYVNCPLYLTAAGTLTADWQCFWNTIHYN